MKPYLKLPTQKAYNETDLDRIQHSVFFSIFIFCFTKIPFLLYCGISRPSVHCSIRCFVFTFLQVVRSRLQEQGLHSEKRYSGVIDCIKKVFQQEGLPGFYRGCATNLLRTTPAAVITFTSFEMIHRFLVTHFPSDPQPQTL